MSTEDPIVAAIPPPFPMWAVYVDKNGDFHRNPVVMLRVSASGYVEAIDFDSSVGFGPCNSNANFVGLVTIDNDREIGP